MCEKLKCIKFSRKEMVKVQAGEVGGGGVGGGMGAQLEDRESEIAEAKERS